MTHLYSNYSTAEIADYLSFVCVSDYRHFTYLGKTKFTKDTEVLPKYIVGSGVAVRSNWCGKSDRSQGNIRFTFEWDKDLNKQKIAQEQQWTWWQQTGLPLSLPPLDTGNKSLHFTVICDEPLSDYEWLKIANGFWKICAEVSKGVAIPDKTSLSPDQGWRIPGYQHNETGREATLRTDLWDKSWQTYSKEYLMQWADETLEAQPSYTKRSKVSTVHSEAELTAQVQAYVENYGSISSSDKLKQGLANKVRTVLRGNNAETHVFALADWFAMAATKDGAPAAIDYFMSLLEAQLTPQDVARGYAWDRDSYRLQIIRGISAGISRETQQTEEEREIMGTRVSHQYISELGIDNKDSKFVFVKSATGTGKTQAIVECLRNEKKYKRILIISHRVALVEQWIMEDFGNNLGFSVYSDNVLNRIVQNWCVVDRLLITVDSLVKLTNGKQKLYGDYDLVIIDEIDQAYSHLLTCTATEVNNHRLRTLHILRYVLTNAKKVVACSAHLSNLEIEVCSRLSNSQDRLVYINDHQPHQKTYIELPSASAALTKVRELLQAGKKVFVACETATDAKALHKELLQDMPDKVGFAIHRDTTGEHAENLRQLNKWVVNLDYLVASPSLCSGFDISVQHFHSVVGIFNSPSTLGVYDLEQFLNRVRYPLEDCYYFCSPALNWQDTSIDRVSLMKRVRERALESSFTIIDPNTGEPKLADETVEWMYEWQELYLQRAVEERISRRSKLRASNRNRGHRVLVLTESAEDYKLDKRAAKESQAKALWTAPIIDKDTIRDWERKGKRLTEEEKLSKQKYWACEFLGVDDLSLEEAEWWLAKGWKTKHCLELLSMSEEVAGQMDALESNAKGMNGGLGASYYVKNRRALVALKEAVADYLAKGSFSGTEVNTNKALAAVIKKYSVELGNLGITVSEKTPSKTITSFLSSVGYEVSSKRTRVDGGRDWHYSFKLKPAIGALLEADEALDEFAGII